MKIAILNKNFEYRAYLNDYYLNRLSKGSFEVCIFNRNIEHKDEIKIKVSNVRGFDEFWQEKYFINNLIDVINKTFKMAIYNCL